MQLLAGERRTLRDNEIFFRVVSGVVEVYAVTRRVSGAGGADGDKNNNLNNIIANNNTDGAANISANNSADSVANNAINNSADKIADNAADSPGLVRSPAKHHNSSDNPADNADTDGNDDGNNNAATDAAENDSYRQLFLLELKAGGAAFPSLDEFGNVDIMLYAVEDAELAETAFAAAAPDELRRDMRAWFGALVRLPWLTVLANRGDDMLQKWADDAVFDDVAADADAAAVRAKFAEHAAIFALLLGVRFKAADRQLAQRIIADERHKKRLASEAIGFLLGETETPLSDIDGSGRAEAARLNEATFIVRQVAAALKTPTDTIALAPHVVKKLDFFALVRRLAQKGSIGLRLVQFEAGWHERDSGAFIGFYRPPDSEEKQPAAILPTEPGKYRLVTLARPDGVPLTDEIAARLDAEAFQCYAGFPARKLKMLDLWKFMFHQCWTVDYRTILLVSLFAGLIPLVTPIITETIFQDILPIFDRQGLATVTQVMMVTSFTLAALSIVRSIAVFRITTHIDMAAEAAFWQRLLSLPTKFFRRYQAGEIVQRMAGLHQIKTVVSGEFAGALFGFVFSFWSLFLMLWYSVKLTVSALGVWFVYLIVTALVYRQVIKYQREMVAASNALAGLVQQIFVGLAKFRIAGAEEQAYYLWAKAFGEEWKWNLKLRWQGNYNAIIGSIQPFILTMLLYWVAVYDLHGGAGITYAQFLAFQAAFTSFNATFNSVIPLVGQFFTLQPHFENIRPFLEEAPEATEDKIDADELTGAIEASHLSFGYQEGQPDVIKDVSFSIAAGESVAIVGRSGCGKSTLLRLLLGFETPRQGAVYYDGQDLADLSLPSVRSQLGVVLQNGQLMQGDIFTNIVGTTTLTLDDAWEAAAAAGIDEDIRQMPMGMQTIISEGSNNISGGQRQRILIARALAMRPSLLIFDEATSALDNRTQAIVAASLEKRRATRIIVAHRLSTIRGCDRIMVLDGGRIVESGKFDELVAQGGLFAQLVRRQVV